MLCPRRTALDGAHERTTRQSCVRLSSPLCSLARTHPCRRHSRMVLDAPLRGGVGEAQLPHRVRLHGAPWCLQGTRSANWWPAAIAGFSGAQGAASDRKKVRTPTALHNTQKPVAPTRLAGDRPVGARPADPPSFWGSVCRSRCRAGAGCSAVKGEFMEVAPRLVLWPGLCLTIVVFCRNMFGDAMRDLLDPRLRGGAGRLGADRGRRPPRVTSEATHRSSWMRCAPTATAERTIGKTW